jgi:hypothetical protein
LVLKNPHKLHKFGTLLQLLGVLVWVPFIALQVTGETPPLFQYLPFHLIGIFGGGSMRRAANQQLGRPKGQRSGYKSAAYMLFVASILVWVPFVSQKLAGRPVEHMPYLAVHLAAVLSGTVLMIIGRVFRHYRIQ